MINKQPPFHFAHPLSHRTNQWRICDVIPEEENMQILQQQHPSSYHSHNLASFGSSNTYQNVDAESDDLFLKPRQVQFLSTKHRRKGHHKTPSSATYSTVSKIYILLPSLPSHFPPE